MKFIFIISFLLLFNLALKAEQYDAIGNLGDTVCVSLRLPEVLLRDEGNTITATMQLQNPTVAYPLWYGLPELSRISFSDSYYAGREISRNFGNLVNSECQCVELTFCFDLLAGSDSIALVKLVNIELNGTMLPDTFFILKSNFLYNRGPYSKPSFIVNLYPNPLYEFQKPTLEFNIDVTSRVEIFAYTSDGRALKLHDKQYTVGVYEVVLDEFPDFNSSSHVFIELRTAAGSAYKPFIYQK